MKSKLMSLFAFVTLLALLPAEPALAQRNQEIPLITMEEAIRLALRNAPSLTSAALEINRAQAQEMEAWLAYFPTVSTRATIAPSGPIRGNPMTSDTGVNLEMLADMAEELGYQINSSIRVIQPIYTFGEITVARDLAAVGFQVSMLQHRKAQLEVVFNVQRAYLSLQLSEVYDDLIQDGVSRLRSARDNLENRILRGEAGARTELRQLIITQADLSGRVADNRMLGRLARAGLAHLCGLEGDFRVTPLEEDSPEELANLEEFQSLAWQHRPDLALLEANVQAQELSARRIWLNFTPNIFFGVQFSFNYNPLAEQQTSPFAYNPYNSRGLGFFLGMDWSINPRWIGQARRQDLRASVARVEQREAISGIRMEIEQAYLEALGHDDRLAAYSEAYRASNAWLRQRTIQFDSGLASFDDLRQPLVAHFGTSANYYKALYDSRLARANLALKVGLNSLELGQGLGQLQNSQNTDDRGQSPPVE